MDWEIDPEEFAAILDEFRSNTIELLRVLTTQLLRLERSPSDGSPIREMFICAHTIKGGAAMLGLAAIRDIAHAMEDALAVLRDGDRRLDPALADVLFRALDVMRDLLNDTDTGATPGTIGGDLIAALRIWASDLPRATRVNQQPCVLLVEDSDTVRALESMLLTDAGLQVDAVSDGRQALEMAQTRQYDIVITGAETRGLRGVELASALRRLPATMAVPIILLSSNDSLEQRQRAAAVGVDAVVSRGSFRKHPMLEVIQTLMNRVKR